MKSRYWLVLLYPEWLPDDFLSVLAATFVPMAVSPLHEPFGRKSHYHVLVEYGNSTTEASIRSLFPGAWPIPQPQPCRGPVGAFEYLTHKNNPEKQQFTEAPVLLSGFKKPKDEAQELLTATEFCRTCEDLGIRSLKQLFLKPGCDILKLFAIQKSYLAQKLLED